jgi:hypothetical protein
MQRFVEKAAPWIVFIGAVPAIIALVKSITAPPAR